MLEISELRAEVERLRKLAHDAPMAKIGQRHTGERFILEHTSAWAERAREYADAKRRLDERLNGG